MVDDDEDEEAADDDAAGDEEVVVVASNGDGTLGNDLLFRNASSFDARTMF